MLLVEGIQASVRGENLRAAGVAKGRALAALVLTQQRFVLYVMGNALVDVTWDSGHAGELDLAVTEAGLEISFDPARVADGPTGRVAVLLRLPDAPPVVAAIEQRRRPLDPHRHLRKS